MPRADSLVSVEIDTMEKVRKIADPDAETPFHILVAGNFSGGEGRHRKAVGIDRDDFDIVMAFLSPEARVSAGGVAAGIRFEEIDDFHPDRLFQNVEAMRALRNLRKRLVDPATFAAAAAEFFPSRAPAAEPPGELRGKSGADLLSMMLGEAPAPRSKPARSDWDEMLRRLVAPYVVSNPDPRQAELVAQADAAIAGHMRSILHDRAFQAIESAWRGLFFLSRRLETGEQLKIFVLDLPQEELATEEGIAAFTRALAEGEWGAIAGLWNFAPSDEPVLTRLAALARNARAPLIAGLAPNVVGLERVFDGLRRTPDAAWLGLALPRFLLRLPYGAATDEIESFSFEEMPSPPEHERYLWGHPAFACACLLGEAFSRWGWNMRPGMVDTIDGLPAHVYRSDGAPELKPCAEVLLTEDAAEALLDRGFIPLVSIRDSDRVRVLRMQSLALAPSLIAGRWR
jgi:type VI secretion system protein ImpC